MLAENRLNRIDYFPHRQSDPDDILLREKYKINLLKFTHHVLDYAWKIGDMRFLSNAFHACAARAAEIEGMFTRCYPINMPSKLM